MTKRRVSQKRLEKESTHFLLRLSSEAGGSDSTGNVGDMEEEEEEEELGEEGDVLCHITLSSPPKVSRPQFCPSLTVQTSSRLEDFGQSQRALNTVLNPKP